MNLFHKDLAERWHTFTLCEQMANIGAEVGRAINWRNKKNETMSRNAFYRALELADFTINANVQSSSLKEICRMREVLVDYFAGDNIYKSTDESWNRYFLYFNRVARGKK
jgi:hypothetical protein